MKKLEIGKAKNDGMVFNGFYVAYEPITLLSELCLLQITFIHFCSFVMFCNEVHEYICNVK